MFSIEEIMTWTAEEAVARLRVVIPTTWTFEYSVDADGWHQISLLDEKKEVQWVGERVDLKLLALDALGWLRVRGHQTQNPIWKPREREVPLFRPQIQETTPDPPDLDPDEVSAVYRDKKE